MFTVDEGVVQRTPTSWVLDGDEGGEGNEQHRADDDQDDADGGKHPPGAANNLRRPSSKADEAKDQSDRGGGQNAKTENRPDIVDELRIAWAGVASNGGDDEEQRRHDRVSDQPGKHRSGSLHLVGLGVGSHSGESCLMMRSLAARASAFAAADGRPAVHMTHSTILLQPHSRCARRRTAEGRNDGGKSRRESARSLAAKQQRLSNVHRRQ
jgi:hypothetical protein